MSAWSGIPEICDYQLCDICQSNKDVDRRQLPIICCAVDHEIKNGDYRQSNLCKKCQENGWCIFGETAFMGQINYLQYLDNKIIDSRSL